MQVPELPVEGKADWNLYLLEQSVHKHPPPQRAIAEPTLRPVVPEEYGAGTAHDQAAKTTEGHHILDESGCSSRISANYVKKRIVYAVSFSSDEKNEERAFFSLAKTANRLCCGLNGSATSEAEFSSSLRRLD
eukprot:CAMPEP_0197658748 /NCGR_PEP_ID=MMETSP1338-20131121/45419_1 /TAXON_ID=43686 ORGANISM="Pelagodinium beii, Strain RCC1491" /NCGR_SAMPLE_ID=MMETSP1338 /ASSEMBLY_ACC=CAM_ASM_000754 /LENGTH=132 /DNA_ID=CAMNT_0043235385 /DNA_START=573 /DNA_END=969 /DNA_ORIENTATION=+